MAKYSLNLLAKLGLAGGAVYLTAQQGIWSSESSQGSSALASVRSTVFSSTNEYIEKIPSMDNLTSSAATKWNSGVKTVFDGLARAPSTAAYYGQQAVDKLKDLSKSS